MPVCAFLGIQIAEIASENYPQTVAHTYDYPCALLTCQMTLNFPRVGTYASVYVRAHVFALSLQKLFKNVSTPLSFLFYCQISFNTL